MKKDNIEILCKECTDERKKQWQKENKNQIIKVGDLIKKEFKDKKLTEHMWVKISNIKGKIFHGTLDNTPILLTNVKYKDEIKFKREDIEDLMEEK